jgi:hypothetical protein
MKENIPSPVSAVSAENQEKRERVEQLKQEAVEAYTELRGMELESPYIVRESFDLLDDTARAKLEKNDVAFEKFVTWNKALLSLASEGDLATRRRADLEVTLFFYNLGFRDALDLENLLDYLEQDLENVEAVDEEGKPNENPDAELENTIKTKIAEIKNALAI